MSQPIPRHPLDVPGSIKLILGQTASDLLAAHGDYLVAVIVHPDATSPPESAGRMILVCLPTDKGTAVDVCNVALGTHIAKKAKPATTATPAAKTAQPAFTP
jgi:hypothetical protein